MGTEDVPDPELIARCLEGEASAWDALIRRYRRLVLAVPLKMRLPLADAEDVFQETFATLLEKLVTVNDRERLGPWLAVIAQRKSLARVSRGAAVREVGIPDGLDVADLRDLAVEELIRLEEQNAVQDALEGLPERCRQLLQALYYEVPTPSYRDLSRRLDIAEGSLGPTRMRCFEKLRQRLLGRT